MLWLWGAHNKANKRLHGQPSEDPLFPKIQFPSQVTCAKCHKAGSTNAHPIWDKDEVLNFLIHMYREENIKQDVLKTLPEKSTKLQGDSERNDQNTHELDWWENNLRKQDLRKIQELRSKRKKSLEGRIVKREWVRPQLKSRRESSAYMAKSEGSSWGLLSGIDLGMCMMFYFVCAIIILLMYYHFTVRRNWKPCGFLPV